jgi:hypothetical protein
MPNVERNAVLVTNTTLAESARFFSGFSPTQYTKSPPSEETTITRRLIEFCNLAECIVLNERVFSLPDKFPDDLTDSPLLRGLIHNGVHERFEPAEFAASAVTLAQRH